VLSAAGLGAAAVLVAGCGSSSSGSPTAGGGTPHSFAAAAYRFADCMRAHGDPNFPDPKITDHNGKQSIAIEVVGPKGPASNGALNACRGILPGPQNGDSGLSPAQRQARIAHILSFARCMRAHSVNNFPDPNSQGLTLEMLRAAGVNIHDQFVITAAEACIPASGGVVTKATIAQAESQGSQ
jgi:hypothetical protein